MRNGYIGGGASLADSRLLELLRDDSADMREAMKHYNPHPVQRKFMESKKGGWRIGKGSAIVIDKENK